MPHEEDGLVVSEDPPLLAQKQPLPICDPRRVLIFFWVVTMLLGSPSRSSSLLLQWPSWLLLLLMLLIRSPPGGAARAGVFKPLKPLELHIKREILQFLVPQKWTTRDGDFDALQKLKNNEVGEAEEEEEQSERHPADELLRRHKADATESYILGGY